jgi:hypothetical protein
VILLSDLGYRKEQELCEKVQTIDLIVGGHTGGQFQELKTIGKCSYYQASRKGKYVAVVEAVISSAEPKTATKSLDYKLVPVEENIEEAGDVKRKVEHVKEMEGLLLMEASTRMYMDTFKSSTARGIKFESNFACSECHKAEDEFQRGTPHFLAYEALENANNQYEPECVKCHTTGYYATGGFSSPNEVSVLASVQCESCHGPGSAHVKAKGKGGTSKAVPKEVCTGCHTSSTSPKFNYEKDLAAVRCQAGGSNPIKP